MFSHSFARCILRTALAVIFTGLLQVSVVSAAILSVEPDAGFASAGDSFAIDLVVSGLGESIAPSVGAFSAEMLFDPTALAFQSYALGSLLGTIGPEAIDVSSVPSPGIVDLVEVSLLTPGLLDALQPASFVLATLSFSVIDLAPAETTLLQIAPGALLSDSTGSTITLNALTPGTVTGSSPVDAPATLLLLFAAGMARFLELRIWRHRR